MKYHYALIFLIIFFVACSNNDDPVGDDPDFVYLRSQEYVSSMQPIPTQILFSALAGQYKKAEGMAEEVYTAASVYKISYKTIFQEEELIASGLVCIPDQAGEYPVLSFQNGTNVEYARAPSVDPSNELYRLLESIATMGFVVVIPDYPGFGISEEVFHPYLEKENTLSCLRDMLKATRELVHQSDFPASLNNDLYLMGYSQGGWSTLQLQHSIEQDGLESYELKASASGAGPYDLNKINRIILQQDVYPMPYFLAFLMQAYHVHNQFSNELNEIFTDKYAAKIPALFDGQNSGEEINAQLTTQVADLIRDGYRNGYENNANYQLIRAAFAKNSIGAWNTSVPIQLFHGADDSFVPIEVSQQLIADFENLGLSSQQVNLTIMPDVNHQTGIIPFGLGSLKWFLDLKSGTP